MLTVTEESLLQFLQKKQYDAHHQKETGQVFLALKINKREYPLFFRLFEPGNLLQLLAFIPCHLRPNPKFALEPNKSAPPSSDIPPYSEAAAADLARLLHVFNKELDLPGFGMDEVAGVVFYRLMVPLLDKKIPEELLLGFIKTIEHVCQIFAPPIEAVSTGQVTLDQILSQAQKVK